MTDYFTKRKLLLQSTLELGKLHREHLRNPTDDVMHSLLLLYISDDGQLPSKEINKLLKMSATRTTRAGQTLCQAGLIKIHSDPNDRRQAIATLTPLGHQLRSHYFSIVFNDKKDEFYSCTTRKEDSAF